MDETFEMPSRTETSEPPVNNSFSSTLPGRSKESLTAGEADYLRTLEEKNRYMTMLLGDKIMEVELTKKALVEHREELKSAYVSILKMHNIEEGKIDTTTGQITVVSKIKE